MNTIFEFQFNENVENDGYEGGNNAICHNVESTKFCDIFCFSFRELINHNKNIDCMCVSVCMYVFECACVYCIV